MRLLILNPTCSYAKSVCGANTRDRTALDVSSRANRIDEKIFVRPYGGRTFVDLSVSGIYRYVIISEL